MSSSGLATCTPDDDVSEAMEAMASEQVRRIPIVDDRGSLVGIVAQADIVRKARDAEPRRADGPTDLASRAASTAQ